MRNKIDKLQAVGHSILLHDLTPPCVCGVLEGLDGGGHSCIITAGGFFFRFSGIQLLVERLNSVQAVPLISNATSPSERGKKHKMNVKYVVPPYCCMSTRHHVIVKSCRALTLVDRVS
jgi:hypothetical protein